MSLRNHVTVLGTDQLLSQTNELGNTLCSSSCHLQGAEIMDSTYFSALVAHFSELFKKRTALPDFIAKWYSAMKFLCQ